MRIRTVVPLLVLALLAACADRSPLSLLDPPDAASLGSAGCELGVPLADAYAGIATLLAEIDALETAGALNSGQARALRNHLNNVTRHLDEGRYCPALAQLHATHEQVGNFVADGVLTAEQAAPLLVGIDEIVSGPSGPRWNPLGSGTSSPGFSQTVYGGDLIVGGNFDMAGGEAASRIARWNGTTWQPLGSGLDNVPVALTVYDGDLIAGGFFTTAGGKAANHIARWDGTEWWPLGDGVAGTVPSVRALGVHDGSLIVGGSFGTAGGLPVNNIARWDGTAWHPFGSGTPSTVSTVGEYAGDLIMGGFFTAAGGSEARHVARWGMP
jgi:hypothetical protein